MSALKSIRIRRIVALWALLIAAMALTSIIMAGPALAGHKTGHNKGGGGGSGSTKTRYDLEVKLADTDASPILTFRCTDCADKPGNGFFWDLSEGGTTPLQTLMGVKITQLFTAYNENKGAVQVWLVGREDDGVEGLYISCWPLGTNRCRPIPATPGGAVTIEVAEQVNMVREKQPNKGQIVGQVFVVDIVSIPVKP